MKVKSPNGPEVWKMVGGLYGTFAEAKVRAESLLSGLPWQVVKEYNVAQESPVETPEQA
jgi:hypothetical protein